MFCRRAVGLRLAWRHGIVNFFNDALSVHPSYGAIIPRRDAIFLHRTTWPSKIIAGLNSCSRAINDAQRGGRIPRRRFRIPFKCLSIGHQSKLGKNCRWGPLLRVLGGNLDQHKGRESMQSNMMPAASGVS